MEKNVFVFLGSPTTDDVYTTFACSFNDEGIANICEKFNAVFFTNTHDFKSIIELVIKGYDKNVVFSQNAHVTDVFLDTSIPAQIHYQNIREILEKTIGKIEWLEPWLPEGDSGEYSQEDTNKIEQLARKTSTADKKIKF